ncbi:WhiB family transcriptional regulator [Streptacidiphilus sp. PB12-B1b]|uniref:WhiB family transcriptional regulator n=1 Tax=Streptacidiphilus sp. PB12-B1b TaxID=2705012 RepID=UPI001CDB4EE1|nr:WhiB family transcriptional regulator [Streptacidiphilus sp. PB12-B1b]
MRSSSLVPLLDSWQWQAGAACRGMASAVFFSPPGERGSARRSREQRAQRVCGTCPVLDQCAAFAQGTDQPFGVWGGLTERQRHARATP